MEHPKKQTYFWLLAVNLFISSFTFGGGYVVVPMIRRYFVTQKQYFTEEDLVGMALPSPHQGHTQSSGRSSNAVPGSIPLPGSPSSGSYT